MMITIIIMIMIIVIMIIISIIVVIHSCTSTCARAASVLHNTRATYGRRCTGVNDIPPRAPGCKLRGSMSVGTGRRQTSLWHARAIDAPACQGLGRGGCTKAAVVFISFIATRTSAHPTHPRNPLHACIPGARASKSARPVRRLPPRPRPHPVRPRTLLRRVKRPRRPPPSPAPFPQAGGAGGLRLRPASGRPASRARPSAEPGWPQVAAAERAPAGGTRWSCSQGRARIAWGPASGGRLRRRSRRRMSYML